MAVGTVKIRIYTLERNQKTLTTVSMRYHCLCKQNKHMHEKLVNEENLFSQTSFTIIMYKIGG